MEQFNPVLEWANKSSADLGISTILNQGNLLHQNGIQWLQTIKDPVFYRNYAFGDFVYAQKAVDFTL